ncbi:MAG: hypothetical protein ABIR70_01615 [Bryobacteraceae bacterium]
MTCADRNKHRTDAALLLRSGEKLIRGARLTGPSKQALIAGPSGTSTQLIQRQADRGTVQPTTGALTLRLGIPGKLPKCFDSEFLRAAVVVNDAGNGTGRGLIVSLK